MSVSFSGISNIVKDILSIAKKLRNNEMVEKVIGLQELLLNAREDNDNLQQEIKELKEKINQIEKSALLERDLDFSESGFFVKKNVERRIPYCSHCWYTKHRLIPLSQYRNWWEYRCGECNVNVTVMDSEGRSINNKTKGEI